MIDTGVGYLNKFRDSVLFFLMHIYAPPHCALHITPPLVALHLKKYLTSRHFQPVSKRPLSGTGQGSAIWQLAPSGFAAYSSSVCARPRARSEMAASSSRRLWNKSIIQKMCATMWRSFYALACAHYIFHSALQMSVLIFVINRMNSATQTHT